MKPPASLFSFLVIAAWLTVPAPAQQAGGLADRFRQLDRNGDGKVSAEELPGPLFRLPIRVPAVLDCGP